MNKHAEQQNTRIRPLMDYSPPLFPAFEIVYKDDDLLVCNKPNGLLTVPGKAAQHKDSLQLRIQRVWPSASIVHRLDMATSGLLIIALNKQAHRVISKQFEQRQVHKTYYAKVLGHPKSEEGIVDLPLICDWPNRPLQMVDLDNGKSAITKWRLIEKFAHASLIKLNPITGRSHQLRVHMQALGHPILGDKLYACETGKSMSKRLCLHAQDISFTHPTTQNIMRFEVPFDF